MADAICRWRNGTPKTVVELVNSLPHERMLVGEFRNIMNSRWEGFFHTPYQLACQLGLYCEAEDGYYYPRFNHDINEKEAKEYLLFWLPRYYIPNPYTGRDGFKDINCPTYFLKSLYEYTKRYPNCKYSEAYESCFLEPVKNNNDIIRNYINSYSKVLTFSKEGQLNITNVNPKSVFMEMDRTNKKIFFDNFSIEETNLVQKSFDVIFTYRQYITAIKSKPFLLLAGISGTGKSRIIRELARACWDKDSEEYKVHKPRNFEIIQVKPNWHDSSELIGYVSRVSGKPEFVAGDFLRFIARAWEDEDMPYFVCLDEMNLAPVEQYFAEYLSVIESRKRNDDGNIVTDPILKPEYEKERNKQTGALVPKEWYSNLINELLASCPTEKLFALKTQFENNGITIPQNLIVIGTVNMDETTFSFSRKVLDRAMTIEMNDVDLHSGLENRHENIGKLDKEHLIGTAVEGVDVYKAHQEVCDKVLDYLDAVNKELEDTPFKVAYRTRNEFLLYVVNNLPYNKDEEGKDLEEKFVIANALDEITSMKILSRIEGDETKIGNLLDKLKDTIAKQLNDLSERIWTDKEGDGKERSVSLAKLEEMKNRLRSGYTSFWS